MEGISFSTDELQRTWLVGSERFIAITIWLGFALHLTAFLPDIIETMDCFSFNAGKQRNSLLIILGGFLVALPLAGIDITVLFVFGALGVGNGSVCRKLPATTLAEQPLSDSGLPRNARQ